MTLEQAEAKTTYYSTKISDCKGDQKTLFKLIDNLLTDHHRPKLPQSHNDIQLANRFSSYFDTK